MTDNNLESTQQNNVAPKKPSRHNKSGMGSISQLPSGTLRAFMTIDGKRVTNTFDTEKERQKWIRKIQDERDNGITVDAIQMTMEKFLAEWLPLKLRDLREKTQAQYISYFSKYIVPHFGKVKLRAIHTSHINQFFSSLFDKGLGSRTIYYIRQILHHVFNQAINYQYITFNPVNGAVKIKYSHQEMNILNSTAKVNKFLETAKENRLYALYYLAVRWGLREAELIGLQWFEIEWDTLEIQVTHQLQHLRGKPWQRLPVKSAFGKRRIPVDKETMDVLRTHQQLMDLEKSVYARRRKNCDFDLVFPTTLGTPVEASNLLQDFKELIKLSDPESKVNLRFHDLRHTAATFLLQKYPLVNVSRWLGHSSPAFTLKVYGHLLPSGPIDSNRLIEPTRQ